MMKFKAMLLFLFLGMVGGYPQDFTTIEMPHEAKQIELNVDRNVKPTIEKEHLNKRGRFRPGEREIKLSSLPLETMVMTSSFGKRIDPIYGSIKVHQGIDLKTNRSSVFSILHGEVIQVGFNSFLGNFIKTQHGKYTALYGHLTYITVKKGDKVKAGSFIGISGSTGKSTGDHLHLTIKNGDDYVHPLLFLKAISIVKTKEDLLNLLTE